MDTAPDTELARACLCGDVSAFETLVQRYERAVFNLAYRLLNDREDAKDITQTAFLKAYQGLESFDPRLEFRSWLYRIAVNESINLRTRRRRMEPLVSIAADQAAGGKSPEEDCVNNDLRLDIQEALMEMKREHRVVIVLRHFLGCSHQEMSQIIQKPVKTVKSRLFTARQILKDLLIQRGVM